MIPIKNGGRLSAASYSIFQNREDLFLKSNLISFRIIEEAEFMIKLTYQIKFDLPCGHQAVPTGSGERSELRVRNILNIYIRQAPNLLVRTMNKSISYSEVKGARGNSVKINEKDEMN